MTLPNPINWYLTARKEKREHARTEALGKLEHAIQENDVEIQRIEGIVLQPTDFTNRQAVIDYYLQLCGLPDRNYDCPNGNAARRLTVNFLQWFVDGRPEVRRDVAEIPEHLDFEKGALRSGMNNNTGLYRRAKQAIAASKNPAKDFKKLKDYEIALARDRELYGGHFCRTFTPRPPQEPFQEYKE